MHSIQCTWRRVKQALAAIVKRSISESKKKEEAGLVVSTLHLQTQRTSPKLTDGTSLAQLPEENTCFLHVVLHLADSFGEAFLHTSVRYFRHLAPAGCCVVAAAAKVVELRTLELALAEDGAADELRETVVLGEAEVLV